MPPLHTAVQQGSITNSSTFSVMLAVERAHGVQIMTVGQTVHGMREGCTTCMPASVYYGPLLLLCSVFRRSHKFRCISRQAASVLLEVRSVLRDRSPPEWGLEVWSMCVHMHPWPHLRNELRCEIFNLVIVGASQRGGDSTVCLAQW